jgi:hypothetical protein
VKNPANERKNSTTDTPVQQAEKIEQTTNMNERDEDAYATDHYGHFPRRHAADSVRDQPGHDTDANR